MTDTKGTKNIVFIHPDLGIGGAERLVVDAAVGLQKLGHRVTIYTSHCDKTHCFDECKDGTLNVIVRGNTIIPQTILGRLWILCAILRQLHLTILLLQQPPKCDYIFIDQLSFCVPLLRLLPGAPKILFYCHFPDKLLAIRSSIIKRLYRIPFDWLEGWTTSLADSIVVNSNFTARIFAQSFPNIKTAPKVVYPCVDTDPPSSPISSPTHDKEERKIILSINRFERKKNIALAVHSFALLAPAIRQTFRLVIAGGYDPRNAENASYHAELVSLADELGLTQTTTTNFITALSTPAEIDVLFLLSIPAKLKSTLLKSAGLLVYTPTNEHFGIVPLEAMLAGTPVLATNTGGPLETVIDGETGWLRPADEREWSDVIGIALGMTEVEKREMAAKARRRVVEEFSKEKMAMRLDGEMRGMVRTRYWVDSVGLGGIVGGLAVAGGFLAFVVARLFV